MHPRRVGLRHATKSLAIALPKYQIIDLIQANLLLRKDL
jgi:hypothetical protein